MRQLQGPWQPTLGTDTKLARGINAVRGPIVVCFHGIAGSVKGNGQANAAFIAHAREDVPALVAEVRQLREALRQIAMMQDSDWQEDDATHQGVARRALGEPHPKA